MEASEPPHGAEGGDNGANGGAGATAVEFVDPVARIRPEQVEASAPGSFVRRVTEARYVPPLAPSAGWGGQQTPV